MIADTLAIGPFAVPTMRPLAVAAVAIFLAICAAADRHVKRPASPVPAFAIVAGMFSARSLFVLTHLSSFSDDPLAMLALWQGGFSATGGVAGAGLAILAFAGIRRRAYLAALVAAALPWLGGTAALAAAQVGPMPTGIEVTQLDGRPIRLDTLRGRPLVLNLWATWCGPCQREIPRLATAAAAQKNVTILLVNEGEPADAVQRFTHRHKIDGSHVRLDQGQRLARATGAQGFPTTLFVDSHGTIRRRHTGEISRALLDDGLASLE